MSLQSFNPFPTNYTTLTITIQYDDTYWDGLVDTSQFIATLTDSISGETASTFVGDQAADSELKFLSNVLNLASGWVRVYARIGWDTTLIFAPQVT